MYSVVLFKLLEDSFMADNIEGFGVERADFRDIVLAMDK